MTQRSYWNLSITIFELKGPFSAYVYPISLFTGAIPPHSWLIWPSSPPPPAQIPSPYWPVVLSPILSPGVLGGVHGRHVSPCRRVADTIMGVMVGQRLMVRKARHWVPPIDQTSVRTKGSHRIWTAQIYTQFILISLAVQRGIWWRRGKGWRWRGISYITKHFWSEKEWRHLHTILTVDTFSLGPPLYVWVHHIYGSSQSPYTRPNARLAVRHLISLGSDMFDSR